MSRLAVRLGGLEKPEEARRVISEYLRAPEDRRQGGKISLAKDAPDGWDVELRTESASGPDLPSGVVDAALRARVVLRDTGVVPTRMSVAGVEP